MVAIGLLGVPPEIQLRIAEFVETSQALKALSVTSRSLRSIAQSMLFESLQIDLGMEPRGSVDDLLANPRICAAIRFLRLRGRFLSSRAPRNDDEQLSLIQKILSEMVGLRKVVIYHVNLSKPFLDAFLGIAANTPLRIHLGWNIYPYSVIPTPHMPLQISHLHLAVDHPSLEFYRSMFHASVTTLTELVIAADGDELMKLAGINLPFLHDLILVFMTGNEISRTSAVAFITAQKAIRRLHLKRTMRPLSPIPPNALPNLRELKASAEQLSQFVPGRPVEAIEIISSQPECDQDWFVEEVGQSTARVRLLRVSLTTPILDTRMVKRMVTVLPFLESLWLPVSNDVSCPFRSITQTLAAHFPSDTPQCRRSPHFTQVPQGPTLQSASSHSLSHSMGRPQYQRHRYQTAECKFMFLTSGGSERWLGWVERCYLRLE